MGWKPEDVALLKRSKKDIKNVDHMIINHDIATVREFMICKVKVWKGYFCPPPFTKGRQETMAGSLPCL